jgi:hypothetical protein
MKKTLLSIFFATIWIVASEFVRNEVLFKHYWTEHYASMGLSFPSAPINAAVWGIWSLCLAISIYVVSKRFSLLHTTLLSWFYGFVLMWLVIGNMEVLPFGILPYAIPLSLLEVFGASWIVYKFAEAKKA